MLPRPTKGRSDSEPVQAVARKAKEALKKVYITTGSYVQMLPWVDDDKIHIMDIYTKLCLVEQVSMKGKLRIDKNNMKSYEEIFHFETREGNPIKRVVISGLAGSGKTTLIDKIAFDWALGNSKTLNRYKLVFVLKMHSLKQSSDLIDATFDHLLDKDSVDQSVLKEFIDKNQDKVLILLDGFDEFKIATHDTSSFGSILKVLNRKQGAECWVVIASRPPLDKLVNSSLVEKPYRHVTVEGFSYTDIMEYMNKFFPDDHDKASKLKEQIVLSDTLFEWAKSPMLLLLMCLIWDAQNTLPDTMTRLYNKALIYIFKRKTRDIKEDAISKILIAIGKVALDHVISADQSFHFREGDFEESALAAAMDAGVLNRRVFDGFALEDYLSVSFIHHTFFEYCAAMYWQSLINTEEFSRILDKIFHRSDYLMRFCCGDNETCANHIVQKMHQHISLELAIICFFESQSEKPPPENVISSVLDEDIEIEDWNNDRVNAFFYFLKRVPTNDYFRRVKYLEVFKFNFERFGEDLVKSITLMTNLQNLILSCCSLLTVSLLTPQLTKLKRLRQLHLVEDSLVPQDVSPMSESIGDMPNLVCLDLSKNIALGGHASLWALHLKKMNHLKELTLKGCDLTDVDMEPIAESVSYMPNLVHLGLSKNIALGGCASLWALHLKKMNHLNELTLTGCNLTDVDMEPIAESVSDMPTLVYLGLSENNALVGCASLWAPHLKQMTKHLRKLRLYGLTPEDKEHITASIGLNLSMLELTPSSNYTLQCSDQLTSQYPS